MTIANINNIRLYYETHGEGPPLLLVAGLASDSQSWIPVLNSLKTHFKVIIFDNRGVGRTAPSDIPLNVHQMTDDCIALIKHLGLTGVNLLGHSMGGFIAMDCAIRYPEYIDRLILAGTAPLNSERNNLLFSDWASGFESGMDPEMWFRNIFYWVFSKRFFKDDKALKEAIQFELSYPYPQSKAAFRNQVKAIADFNCSQDLSRIKSKTLVLFGDEDLLFPEKDCRKLLEIISNSEFTVISDAAHSIHMDNPAAFTERILEFLQG